MCWPFYFHIQGQITDCIPLSYTFISVRPEIGLKSLAAIYLTVAAVGPGDCSKSAGQRFKSARRLHLFSSTLDLLLCPVHSMPRFHQGRVFARLLGGAPTDFPQRHVTQVTASRGCAMQGFSVFAGSVRRHRSEWWLFPLILQMERIITA